jgi:hypothetical protein
MAQTPNPFEKRTMLVALGAGLALAALGVILFVAVWVALGNAGVGNAARLFASLCVPPAIIGALVGGFSLFQRRRQQRP